MAKTLPPPVYPIRFKEIFKDKIWGGDAIKKKLGKKCGAHVGESWEISDVGRDVSVAANGPWKGRTLRQILDIHAREVLGEEVHIRHQRFPLMVKFLHAHDRLSLQVHPNDEFARSYEPDGAGKMEAWYVLGATPDSRIIRGVLPGTTEAEFRESLQNGKIEDCINKLRVKEGEVIFIPPGTVHSAYGDLLLVEVQQASDHTYRLTDWGRTGPGGKTRDLQLEKGIRAMDLQSIGVSKLKPTRVAGVPYKRLLLIRCEKFTMEKIELASGKKARDLSDPNAFRVYTFLSGAGKIAYGGEGKKKFASSEPYASGQTFLIPARLGPYEIQPSKATDIIVCSI